MNESVGESVGAGPGQGEYRGDSPGAALRDYAHAELDAALARLGWRGGRLHAGVHLARKSLRRARATLELGGAALGSGAAMIDRELRRINDALSSLRDAQALVETLDRQLSADHDAMTIPLLRRVRRVRRVAAAARAVAAHDARARDPAMAGRRAMLRVLVAALVALPWENLSVPQLHAALADSQARMNKAQQLAIASGDDEHWHRWRRRARRLSQQRRALKTARLHADLSLDDPALDRPAFDKRTTELLGVAQDLSLLLEHCGRRSLFSKPDRAALRRFAKPELARLRQRIAHAAHRL